MRLAAAVGCAMLLASCGGTSSPSSSTAPLSGVSASRAVHDVAVLDAVSCATATHCLAVGATSVDGTGVVVPITNGVPGSPVTVDGSKSLDAVSCPTAAFCEAVGAGDGFGIAVPVSSGSPGQLLRVAGTTALNGVSCPTGPLCEAGGRSATQGLVVTITSPSDALPVSPVAGTTSVNDIDCVSNSLCQVVASTSNGSYNDVVATVASGTPQAFRVVPPGTSTFSGIACSSTVTCVAVGNGVHLVNARNIPEGVVVSTVNGTPGKLVGLPATPTVHLEAVSCGGPSRCVAVGTNGLVSNGTSKGHGVYVTIANGAPSQPNTIPGSKLLLDGVSCPTSSSCVAVGTNGTAQVVTLPVS
ncbi:MAG: hypothetical protein ABSC90_17435 [Acidimicrobiales bacterium]